jgi:pyridoxine/pyridoxamine 5'-phosphate oxidase
MVARGKNDQLIQAAEAFALAVKNFDGDPSEQMKLLKQADKLRFLVETPLDTVMKQWEMVSDFSSSLQTEFNRLLV